MAYEQSYTPYMITSPYYFFIIMAYNAVMRLIDKAFSQSENFHVGMKRLEAEITWKEDRQPRFIPFVDSQGHQGMRVIIEKKEDN